MEDNIMDTQLKALEIRDRLFKRLDTFCSNIQIIFIYKKNIIDKHEDKNIEILSKYNSIMQTLYMIDINQDDISDAVLLKHIIEKNHDVKIKGYVEAWLRKSKDVINLTLDKNNTRYWMINDVYKDTYGIDYLLKIIHLFNNLFVELFPIIALFRNEEDTGEHVEASITCDIKVPDKVSKLFGDKELAKRYYEYCEQYKGDNERIVNKYNEYAAQNINFKRYGHKKILYDWLHDFLTIGYDQFKHKLS
jgi:hypothetical protein